MRASLPLLLLLPACCGRDAPVWTGPDPIVVGEDERVTVDLAGFVVDDGDVPTFTVDAGDGVLAALEGSVLAVLPESGFTGESSLTLTATDACGNVATTEVPVLVGGAAGACPTTFTYTARGDADGVFLAGSFNDWSASAAPMAADGDAWSITVDLPPGPHTYKFVEADYTAGTEAWACDPEGPYTQCDEGYTWDPSCPLGGGGCNSLVVVPDCSLPTLTIADVAVDRDADTITIDVAVTGDIESATATLDGAVIDAWDGTRFRYTSDTLSDGRHTLRFDVTDTFGRSAEQLYVPVWLDDRDWAGGMMYYVFVDRFADGDTSRDASESTSAESTDYAGGDWQGVIDKLDYLDDLGVTVLWLTAPQDNASGAWGTTCNTNYSGYHGYWPSDAFGTEEHFGDAALLRRLVDEAHARGMRVLTDWVGNHVHSDHPYYAEHPEWFTTPSLCGDADNWNDIPETCWFDSFLPDIRYYDVEPLTQMVDDAMVWAKEYEFDGYRVDAVKHMPHSVFYNFATRARGEIEHVEDFYTVGETYSGDRDLIGAYVNERELDGQFDFPVYWAIVAAFARGEIGLSNGDGSLQDTFADSEVAFGGHLMSTFLGNHDVARFIPQATGEIGSLYGDSACNADGSALRGIDTPPDWAEPYQRLNLAWTFLLTSEGLPLVYYGDEIGLPGFNDPDNRQMMRFGDELSTNEAMVLAHVMALGQARRDHPAFSRGTRVDWWSGEADFYAYARATEEDGVLVLLNRAEADRSVTNGLAFAGLPQGRYRDVLTGDTFDTSGDALTIDVPALGSRVLVAE
ncbi:MAG: alpha-amylase family glycosyl hydrolase [Pseudomonadota bacterium]|nr:alpha-amylase family glycosyl hydrolase [Pseudomonadota bacterium]